MYSNYRGKRGLPQTISSKSLLEPDKRGKLCHSRWWNGAQRKIPQINPTSIFTTYFLFEWCYTPDIRLSYQTRFWTCSFLIILRKSIPSTFIYYHGVSIWERASFKIMLYSESFFHYLTKLYFGLNMCTNPLP